RLAMPAPGDEGTALRRALVGLRGAELVLAGTSILAGRRVPTKPGAARRVDAGRIEDAFDLAERAPRLLGEAAQRFILLALPSGAGAGPRLAVLEAVCETIARLDRGAPRCLDLIELLARLAQGPFERGGSRLGAGRRLDESGGTLGLDGAGFGDDRLGDSG